MRTTLLPSDGRSQRCPQTSPGRRGLQLTFGLLVLLAVAVGTGCSGEGAKVRHLEAAERYFQEKRFAEARLEYINVLQLEATNVVALERLGTICYDQGQTHQAFGLLLKAKSLGLTKAGSRLKLARLLLSVGEVDKARDEATAVLASSPENDEALLLLGDAIAKPAQLEETEAQLRALLAQNPNRAATHVALGKLALMRGDGAACAAELNKAVELEPKSTVAHLALAGLAWSQGNVTNAHEQFKTAVELAGDDWPIRLKWAEFKFRTGDPGEAVRIVQSIIETAPKNIPALLGLARMTLAQGKPEESLAYSQRILDDKVPEFEAMQLHAQAVLAKGDVPQATKEFEQLRDKLPKVPQMHYNLALAYLKSKRIPEASATLRQAIALDPNFVDAVLLEAQLSIRQRDFASGVKAVSDLLTRSPKAERAYPVLAEAYRSQGALDQALNTCQRWMELFPSTPQAPFFRGLIFRQQQRNADARKAFEAALRLAPGYVSAVEQLVDLDLRDKQPAAALQRAEEFVKHAPQAPQAWLLLAKVRLAQNSSADAEIAMQKALELDPGSSAAGMLLAQLYVRSNRQAEALKRLEDLVAKKPNDWAPLSLLALIQQETKDYPKARASYERVIQLNPQAASAFNNLAYLCLEHFNDLEAAYTHAQKAKDLAPEDPSIADTFGWVLFHRREYPWALAALQEAAVKMPSQPEVQFHLAMAQDRMGEEDDARGSFRRVLDLDKDSAVRTNAEERLWILNLEPAKAGPGDTQKLQRLLAADPNDVVVLLRSAAIADQQGALDQALDYFSRAAKANPRAPTVLLKLGRFYSERLHQPAKALEQGNLALKLAPADPVVARVVGRIALDAGDDKRAYTLLQDSAKSDDAEALFDLAQASYRVSRSAQAHDLGRRVVDAKAAFPRQEIAARFLDMLALSEDPVKAAQSRARIEQIVQVDPDHLPALMALAVAQEQAQRYGEAKQLLEDRVLKGHPDFALGWRKLAFLYGERLGDEDKAFAAGIKAREAFPEDPALARMLGKIAYRRQNYTAAVQFLRTSLEKGREDAELYFYLGMAQNGLKQSDQSRTSLKKALALNLDPKLAQEANRVIKESK